LRIISYFLPTASNTDAGTPPTLFLRAIIVVLKSGMKGKLK
jgi:hypothetical protein